MYKKIIFFIFIIFFFPTSNYAQSTESILKLYCNCETITSTELLGGNKIFYIKNDTEDFGEISLSANLIEKINGQWVNKYKSKISFVENKKNDEYSYSLEDFQYANTAKNQEKIELIKIKNSTYLYAVIDLGMAGTANNGTNYYLFYFQNITQNESPIKILYSRSDGEFTGNYMFEKGNLNEYYDFITETNKFITSVFGENDEDIDSINNYALKWKNVNSKIENHLESYNQSILQFVTFDGINLFNELTEDFDGKILENENYKVFSGFKSPCFMYDKKYHTTNIVYIPSGWPNGGSWGLRSFIPKKLTNNQLILESDFEILKIDLKNKNISSTKKD